MIIYNYIGPEPEQKILKLHLINNYTIVYNWMIMNNSILLKLKTNTNLNRIISYKMNNNQINIKRDQQELKLRWKFKKQ